MAIKNANHELELDPELFKELVNNLQPQPTAQDRTLFILGEVSHNTIAGIAPALAMLDSEPGDIVIRITTPGGEVESGLAIYDMIRGCRNKVITEAYGLVASIGALIFQAGDKRLMAPHSSLMIHASSVHLTDQNNIEHLKSHIEDLEITDKQYAELVGKRSKFTTKEVIELIKQDTYYTPKEAIKNGFADGLIQGKKTWLK